MKIKSKSKMIIVASLLIAVTLFMVFHFKEKKAPVAFCLPFSDETQYDVKSMTGEDDAFDLYCSIVLMSKSMAPTIEQFSKHKLAKDIKFLPAKIEWDNGCMFAPPNKSVFAYDNPEVVDTQSNDVQDKNNQPEKIGGADIKKLHPALIYLFLANASKSQINY